MLKHFALLCILIHPFMAYANGPTPSSELIDEYERLRAKVSQLKSDNPSDPSRRGEKEYGTHFVFWSLEDRDVSAPGYHETIRIFIPPTATYPKNFAVSYHKSTHILSEALVLRKFVGPEPSGWRNDTINYATKEYLGMQGSRWVETPEHVEDILAQWDITPFIF